MGMLVLREREHTGRVDVFRFWERRLRRLLPAAIATLAGIAALSAHGGFRAGRNGLRAELLSALAYVANWRLLREGRSYASLFESPSPVQHFWSLSIEEQFYVFFPLLILGLYFLGRRRRRVVVIALADAVRGERRRPVLRLELRPRRTTAPTPARASCSRVRSSPAQYSVAKVGSSAAGDR